MATSLAPLIEMLRRSERSAARSVSHFVAISRENLHRIKDAFGRESDIIPPAIEFDRYRATDQIGDSYLVVSRLVPYKRIDLAVRAFTYMGKDLIIAGDGRDRASWSRWRALRSGSRASQRRGANTSLLRSARH